MLRDRKGKIYTALAGVAVLATGCQPLGKKSHFDLTTLPPWDLGEVQRTFKVSSIADAGPGTLREAIQLANRSPGTDKIIFESNDDLYQQPQTIYLESPLPEITDNLLIDGYIEDVLWKPSGITIDGKRKYRILKISEISKVKIKHLTLSNGAAVDGAAIYTSGELVVEGSTFNDNTAKKNGGAIYAEGLRTIIYNSTFYDNSAVKNGGGLSIVYGEGRLTNTTFTKNSAKLGGGIFNSTYLAINNSIVANSIDSVDCHSSGVITSNVQNIIETNTGCGIPYLAEDPILGTPRYLNGPTRTINLGMRSPATNYGDYSVAVDEYGNQLRWDQRGNGDPRNAAGVADIGAFETQAQNVVVVDTIEDTDYRWCVVFKNDCSLRGALRLATNDFRFPVITFDPEVFSQPVTLTINGEWPEMKREVTLDASATPGIKLEVDSDSVLCRKPGLIKLENVRLNCR